MDYRSGQIGRVFWVRFNDGEDLTAEVIELARREEISQALVLFLGALKESNLVVGPRETVIPPDPVVQSFTQGREMLGVGTLAPGPDGPALHLHVGAGRVDRPTLVGCLRADSRVYLLIEAVVLEIQGIAAARKPDQASGLNLLQFGPEDE